MELENTTALKDFISRNFAEITDPYEGEALDDDWTDTFEVLTVQEVADHSITKCYDVCEDIGLGGDWIELDDCLTDRERKALLGVSYPLFDPGCYGSYFQNMKDLEKNIKILSKLEHSAIIEYHSNLKNVQKGLYVTF